MLIITIAASTLIIQLSYGIFREYNDREELSQSVTNKIQLKLQSSYSRESASDVGMIALGNLEYQIYEKTSDMQDVTVADMKKFASELDVEIADKLLNVQTGILQGKYRFETNFLLSDRKIVNSADYGFDSLYNFDFGSKTMNTFQYGRYFSDDEYAKGKKVCIMYGFQKKLRGKYLKKYLLDNGNVLIGDHEYHIIGLQNGVGTGYIPLTSVNEDSILLDKIDMQFKDNISLREVNSLLHTAKKCFGDRIISDYSLEETDENNSLYDTILLLVVVVSLVAAFNFCALYHYIVTTRQRTLEIFRVCGLTYRRSIWLYLGECSILSVGTYAVTLLMFRFILMPFLAQKISVFDFHYKAVVYLALFLIWFVSSFLLQYVMIRWNLKKKMIR